MDNLTHSLAGWTLGQTGLKRRTRKGLAALILSANMPDVDVFFGWVPWEPLATHRGFTHGLFGGVLLMPPLLAALLWGLDRWQQRRGAVFSSGLEMRFGWLLALSYIGALSHPLLDWQNTYSVQLLSPFSDAWFHADALFIVDVWILSGLALAVWVSRRRERGEGDWRRPARIGLVAVVGYVAVNSAISSGAKRAASAEEPYAAPDSIYASAPPLFFWRREVIWRQDGQFRWGTYDPFWRLFRLRSYTDPVADNMAEPLVRRALATPELRPFARWSTMPFARVQRQRCAARVRFGDARYGRTIEDNRFAEDVLLPTSGPGC